MHPWRSAMTLGLRRVRSSPMMSLPDRSPGSRLARKTRKAGSTTSMESLTADIALPGLEKAVVTESQRGHWLARPGGKRLMFFSGRSPPDLARAITDHLGVEIGAIELHTFGNDETY